MTFKTIVHALYEADCIKHRQTEVRRLLIFVLDDIEEWSTCYPLIYNRQQELLNFYAEMFCNLPRDSYERCRKMIEALAEDRG